MRSGTAWCCWVDTQLLRNMKGKTEKNHSNICKRNVRSNFAKKINSSRVIAETQGYRTFFNNLNLEIKFYQKCPGWIHRVRPNVLIEDT